MRISVSYMSTTVKNTTSDKIIEKTVFKLMYITLSKNIIHKIRRNGIQSVQKILPTSFLTV